VLLRFLNQIFSTTRTRKTTIVSSDCSYVLPQNSVELIYGEYRRQTRERLF